MTTPKTAAADPWEIVFADFTAAAGIGSTLPENGPEVAFAGRSNVGKSSLINMLTGRRNLVRTGATPGVTRTLTQFAARTRAGFSFAFVDLPGYGFAQRSKAERDQWAKLIEGYLRKRPQLGAVVLLVDVRRGLEEDDRALIDFVAAAATSDRPQPEVILVATKIDKISKSEQLKALSAIGALTSVRPIAASSVSGQGKSELGRRIATALERIGSGSAANA
ncbi:MAG: ribosome biogenesis GTP-binding protein YsxC [Polyangiaceae bacterium]|nr:ribosome biogenesis GTP-binding protein YsxC [Polyangiaceae bacterium]